MMISPICGKFLGVSSDKKNALCPELNFHKTALCPKIGFYPQRIHNAKHPVSIHPFVDKINLAP